MTGPHQPTTFVALTRAYEEMLRSQFPPIEAHLDAKHEAMAADPFACFRGSMYRRAEQFPLLCPDLQDVPHVWGVVDLHVANFGTWRDGLGRLAWGVNDLDEATWVPYTTDLSQLAASAHILAATEALSLQPAEASAAVLDGYTDGMRAHGAPFLLDGEHHDILRHEVTKALKSPSHFWLKLTKLPEVPGGVTGDAGELLTSLLPSGDPIVFHPRQAGVGSLGRPRWVAVSTGPDGQVAREAKIRVVSAWDWVHDRHLPGDHQETIMLTSNRVSDRSRHLTDAWTVRGLAPDAVSIDLAAVPEDHQRKLLWSMGWETANVHLGTSGVRRPILDDLAGRPASWLHDAATAIANRNAIDHAEWRAHHRGETARSAATPDIGV